MMCRKLKPFLFISKKWKFSQLYTNDIFSGNEQFVEKFVQDGRNNITDKDKQTLLHIAAKAGSFFDLNWSFS